MTPCARELELVRALTASAGAPALSAERHEHLRTCADCREAVVVASALANESVLASREASPPSAEIVWFRAQVKARADAAALAARPVFVVQALAAAAVAGAVAGLAGTLSTFDITPIAGRGILLAFAVWLLIVPVAVYLAATED